MSLMNDPLPSFVGFLPTKISLFSVLLIRLRLPVILCTGTTTYSGFVPVHVAASDTRCSSFGQCAGVSAWDHSERISRFTLRAAAGLGINHPVGHVLVDYCALDSLQCRYCRVESFILCGVHYSASDVCPDFRSTVTIVSLCAAP